MQLSRAALRASVLIAVLLGLRSTMRRAAADEAADARASTAGADEHATALAGAPPAPASPSPWRAKASFDAAAYADSDHVYVLTPAIAGAVSNPVTGFSAGAEYLVDVVSAASVDIVATASPNWIEVRHAATLDAAYKPRAFGLALDGDFSIEPDYVSWTAGALATQDLMDDDLTLLLGVSHGHDVAGRAGTPFSVFAHRLDREWVRAGATAVLDRATIASLLADVVIEHGDPGKPYRYVPLFAPGTVVPRGASVDEVTRLRVSARPLERLPQSRNRYAVTLRVAHRFDRATLRGDERLYADSWQLFSSTTDGRYLLDLGQRWELGPHLRFHLQTPVSFWQRGYVLRPGFDYPALRTGDRELGPLLGLTLGWSVRWAIGPTDDEDTWLLGWDMNATETRYLDHLYIEDRLSALTAFSIEAQL